MNKTMIEYIKNRVNSVAKCVNGKIEQYFDNQFKITASKTVEELLQEVDSGQAKLKSLYDKYEFSYHPGTRAVLCTLFDFPISDMQRENELHNDRVRAAKEEALQLVEQEAKLVIDRAVLGLINETQLIEEIKSLGKMDVTYEIENEIINRRE